VIQTGPLDSKKLYQKGISAPNMLHLRYKEQAGILKHGYWKRFLLLMVKYLSVVNSQQESKEKELIIFFIATPTLLRLLKKKTIITLSMAKE